ncbi:ABC transporter permease [Georgenia satyanarayanai]|uniref:ABC transporter permease n=1 Tax=Georgenia satyanarayanai TaxID=860221 RepID=UPI00203C99F6|nr:ABC transporter permease [Georgenia satyanarayanai]MCM3661057.1 ABC transporter permease [Georgenia satyanarayanai]
MDNEAEARAAALAREELRPASPRSGFITGARESLTEIWQRRELLDMLVRRELRARYKDSSLGLLWSLARPLVQLLIYYLAIGRILGAERAIPDFAIYVFAGITAWTLLAEIVQGGTASILANSGIVKKIYLPREIFPLSVVGSAIFNFLIQLGILLVAAVLVRGLVLDERLLYLPLGLLVIVSWGTAFALVLAAANVYLRDIQYLVEVAIMVGFWLSPIVYSWSMVADTIPDALADIYLLNPVTLSTLAFQRSVWVSGPAEAFPPDHALRLLVALAIGGVLLILAQRLFARMQRDFAQEL